MTSEELQITSDLCRHATRQAMRPVSDVAKLAGTVIGAPAAVSVMCSVAAACMASAVGTVFANMSPKEGSRPELATNEGLLDQLLLRLRRDVLDILSENQIPRKDTQDHEKAEGESQG